MKQSKEVIEQRRKALLQMVEKLGDIQVNEMATYFQVSPLTIRRDLQYLEDKKRLNRYYGGAKVLEEEVEDTASYKMKIAQYAASLVADGDTIFINTSSTALGILPFITAKDVTVITNNGNAIHMKHSHHVTVVLLGGELRYIKGAMVGDFALNNLNRVTAKKSFIGCSGVSVESGMTTEFINEVNINAAMFARVTEAAYVLADATKLGKNNSFVSCPIEGIHHVITDDRASEPLVEGFLNKGIKVHCVK